MTEIGTIRQVKEMVTTPLFQKGGPRRHPIFGNPYLCPNVLTYNDQI